MAVVARKRKKGITYYVSVRFNGRKIFEHSGTDKREAERLNKRRIAELRAGTFHPKVGSHATVRSYAEHWLDGRTTREAANDASVFRRLILTRDIAAMQMEDVRPRHVAQLLVELRQAVSDKTGAKLSEKYIGNIVGLLGAMFSAAVLEEVVGSNPVKLPRGAIRRRSGGSTRQPYALEAIRRILSCQEIPPYVRVFAAMLFYTGMRKGEAAGRRWRDWDRESQPLGCLTVATQYDDRPLKTDEEGDARPRKVPVHEDLEQVLDWWWSEGFALQYGRAPTANDFIVPQRAGRGHAVAFANQTKSSTWKMWSRGLAKAGVPNQTVHATRHSFITHARRFGASKDWVERITHNAKGDIVDNYTHAEWGPLCEVVAKLDLRGGVTAGVTRSAAPRKTGPMVVEALGIEVEGHGSTTRESSYQRALPAHVDGSVNNGTFRTSAAKGAARHPMQRSATPTLPEVLRDSVAEAYVAVMDGDEDAARGALAVGAEALAATRGRSDG